MVSSPETLFASGLHLVEGILGNSGFERVTDEVAEELVLSHAIEAIGAEKAGSRPPGGQVAN